VPLGSESSTVQRPFVRYAVEAGWTYVSPDEALALRSGGLTSPVLDTVLLAQLQKLNHGVVDADKAADVIRRLVRVRPSIEGNLDAWEFLKGLKTVFLEAEKRERNIRVLDPSNVGVNVFHVTDEFTFSSGPPPDIRPDIAFFVNGIPAILVETKRASHRDGIAEAFDDIRFYHEKGPGFLALNQVHALTHLIQFYYGATWTLTRKALFNWRDENVPDSDFESLCKSFVAPGRVLCLLTECILFTRKDDDLSKVVLRPHQMRAVERCVGRAREAGRRRGLVWHTQGSGKTYTMITTAHRLLADPAFENPTVVMLVDRNELEEQLFRSLEQCGFGRVDVARSKAHLERLLREDRRGLIVSMIHKFEGMRTRICARKNVFVLVDEAHRTTGGDLGNYLMGALPNATYLGFTGTPIDRTAHGQGTFKVFGADDAKGYLDKYSIRESIRDGTTVPIHYALAPNELRVDRDTLEREFLGLAEAQGVSDIAELNKVLEKAVTLRNMLKSAGRVEKVAAFVAEHFKASIEPMGYKAFVVAVDREACCLVKDALDRHLPPSYSRVVISGQGKRDPGLLRKFHLTDDAEKAVRKAFRQPDALPKILIVTEKLLTGFDAPHLYGLYLDKPMRDHVLLQAIARVNRPYEDPAGRRKPCGFILDFVGVFENLERALAFDSRDVSGVIESVDVLRRLFEQTMAQGRRDYLPIVSGRTGDKAVEVLLEHFRDKEARQSFYTFYRELRDTYEILSPDPFLRPFMADYRNLAEMFYILRSRYDRGALVDREFQRKTALLVREHTAADEFAQPTRVHRLDAESLEALAAEHKPATVKVFNLLKAVHGLVHEKAAVQPYLFSIGERAEAVAQAYEARQITAREALEALQRLVAEYGEAEWARRGTGLKPEAFAVYWLLKRAGVRDPMQVAKAAAEAFEKYPHWQVSERQEQDIRRCLYKSLIAGGVDGVPEVAATLMRMLRRARE
jgi:type I restriction enzyme R subunit